MDANDVTVGFLQTRPKRHSDGEKVYHVKLYDEAGALLKKPLVEETLEAYGYRVMHVDMLGRIARRLTEIGAQGHLPGIVGWLTETPPDAELIEPMAAELAKLEQGARGRAKGSDNRADRQRELKDAAYFEAAAFCWRAWLAS